MRTDLLTSNHSSVGHDAARAFATGCFKEHKTHDIRGLSDDELRVRLFHYGISRPPTHILFALGSRTLEEVLRRT